ncbi:MULTISPECIES: deoxyguanosinetriphosphate triphosphohydrolase family protein [Clostridium]|uniref:Deoxyguanosinetriphosphate triphosphohydrolase n=1 Tax=Clostridium ragsdalei P11 TaxID=1353534 RepID=A0A1A6APJ3_9CLOT|nr:MULTISPECIES: HD domain-containing protein [Clostridium]OBR91977.1 deoxyguanosinetriphosphate triphosphohydrolase [Clostridium ragsdalei P11]QXE19647.1 hypothetical protein B5S50_12890 [Clostridium sp. 001]
MERKKFLDVATTENNKKWKQSISRENKLYKRNHELRSEFSRDYNRILHSTSYRRLKHKTQVFFATDNDHICTRIEHVNHVSAVSYTIANYLGLNTQLTTAIAIGHDLGHTPFGHEGEKILGDFSKAHLGNEFWHEKNSLRFVDKIETLPNPAGKQSNLDLTYAVRDGIVCHCGEVRAEAIFPRDQVVDLNDIQKTLQISSYTWEGCVVKIADKISYLGRDIEDAFKLGILKRSQLKELYKITKDTVGIHSIREINNTVLMHNFIVDLCQNSSPDNGIVLSSKYLNFIDLVKEFNYENIYNHERLNNFKNYVKLVLDTILNTLMGYYDGEKTLDKIKDFKRIYPSLHEGFSGWLKKYCIQFKGRWRDNEKIYDLKNYRDYIQAIIDYTSGMTDNFAIRVFNEMLRF